MTDDLRERAALRSEAAGVTLGDGNVSNFWSGWRPIETAPRDGTEILIAPDNEFSSRVRIARYDSGHPFGWRTDTGSVGPSPTRWMPLPAPPGDELLQNLQELRTEIRNEAFEEVAQRLEHVSDNFASMYPTNIHQREKLRHSWEDAARMFHEEAAAIRAMKDKSGD